MQTLLDKFKNISWTAGKAALATTTTAAMLTGGAIATDQAINKYEMVDGERVIQIENQAEEARVRISENRPEATLEKWNGEVGMKVSYPKVRTKGNRRAFTNKLRYTEGNDTVAMEPVDGGYKIDVVWQDMPATNTVTFQLDNTENLDFFYQPELTQEEKDNGAIRPENVVGSYAVYHKTKKNHVVGGINYETGKAFHIYRPKVIDDEGNETWGELKYENGQLSVTVDQSFLDKASYPVVVDPTFGYTTAGGSNTTGDTSTLRSPNTNGDIASSAGFVESVQFYGYNTSGNFKGVITDGTETILTDGVSPATSVSGTVQWNISTYSNKPTIVNGNTYEVWVVWDVTTTYYYDAGALDAGFDSSNSYTSPTSPSDFSASGNIYSLYATYTATTPSVTTASISSITRTSADGNGDVTDSGSSAVTERGVVWNTTGNPDTTDNKATTTGTTGTFSASMTGLSPNTTYYVRAYAINSDGTGYGEELDFTTLSLDPPTVTTSAAGNISTASADGNGEITATGGEDASERGFVYDTISHATPTPSEVLLDSESFETSLGDWTNDVSNVSDWIRDSGGTPSSNTGPSTGQDGSYYIYVETSNGNSFSNGDTDIIEYNLGSTLDGYVDFYYHQYGDDQGTIYLEGWDGSSWTSIWSSTGDQGNQWNHVQQASTDFSGYSQLRFKNVAAGSFNGDIALDNINVYQLDSSGLPTGDYSSVENETGTFGTGTFSLTMSGLSSDTTYYTRAYAKNSVGYSYGDEESFTTSSSGGGTSQCGYDSAWDYREKVTVDSTQVASTLTDFPVYVDLSNMSAGFWTNVQSNGGDIRVTESDGTTEVPFEIVDIDTGTDTGQLHFKAGSLSSSADTEFYIYYGNAAASGYANTGTYGRNNVWTQYEAVWHLEEDPSGTSPQMVDSTGNGYDTDSIGSMTSGDLVSATLGNGLDFDGSNDYLRTSASYSTYAGTGGEVMWVSAIIDNIGANAIDSVINFSDYHGFQVYNGSMLLQSSGDNSGVDIAAADVDDGLVHFVHGAYIQGTEYRIYKDGSEVVQKNTTDTEAANDQIYIGELQNQSRLMGGVIDEVRWGKTDLGANWVSAEYTNQNTPATFYTAGGEEECAAGGVTPQSIYTF